MIPRVEPEDMLFRKPASTRIKSGAGFFEIMLYETRRPRGRPFVCCRDWISALFGARHLTRLLGFRLLLGFEILAGLLICRRPAV
jgi:hypothetical protein